MTAPSLPPVLIVDDNSDDLLFAQRLLAKAGVRNPVVTSSDGWRVIESLDTETDSPAIPCLLMVDARIGTCSGLEIVRWIRAQPRFSALGLVVMSGIDPDPYIRTCAECGAAFWLKFPAVADVTEFLSRYCSL